MVFTHLFSPNWFLGKYYYLCSSEEKLTQINLINIHLALPLSIFARYWEYRALYMVLPSSCILGCFAHVRRSLFFVR